MESISIARAFTLISFVLLTFMFKPDVYVMLTHGFFNEVLIPLILLHPGLGPTLAELLGKIRATKL